MITKKMPKSIVLMLLVGILAMSCQMDPIFSGASGNVQIKMILPHNPTTAGSSSRSVSPRLLLPGATHIVVTVFHGDQQVSQQTLDIAPPSLSATVKLTLTIGWNYTIKAEAYDATGTTKMFESTTDFTCNPNANVASMYMVPYSAQALTRISPANQQQSIDLAQGTNSFEVMLTGSNGFIIPSLDLSSYQVYVQNSDGSLIQSSSSDQGYGPTVVYANQVKNPNAPIRVTLFLSGTGYPFNIIFPFPMDIVYNDSSPRDISFAKELQTLVNANLNADPSVTGVPQQWNVNLVPQSTIPKEAISNYALSGGLVVLTPGTTLWYPGGVEDPNITFQIENLTAAAHGFIVMGHDSQQTFDAMVSLELGSYPLGTSSNFFSTVSNDSLITVLDESRWYAPLTSSAIPKPGASFKWNSSATSIQTLYLNANADVTVHAIAGQPAKNGYAVIENSPFMEIGIDVLPDTIAGKVFLTNLFASYAVKKTPGA